MRDKDYQPWHRFISKGESQPAHDLFLVYCSFGAERSSNKVAAETGRSEKLCRVLCNRFHWVRRSRAYDKHLRDIREKAIENLNAQEALIFKERETQYREECYQLSQRLLNKVQQMLDFALYASKVETTQKVKVGEEEIEVPLTIINVPVKWTAKDISSFSEVQDKLHRMAFGVPTSRVAVSVQPNLTLEERIEQARAKMDFYVQHRLEKAVQRIWEKDTSKDPREIRQEIMDELPVWMAQDFAIPDPLLLTAGELEPKPLSLDDEEPIEAGGVN